MPLKSSIKTKKQMRFAGQPVTSVKTIPPRKTRPHPPKWSQDAADPELLIPIELSQPRTEQDQDLRGNLSAVSPRESHQSEETLPNIPLGQFQAQEGNSTSKHSIAPSDTKHPPKVKYSLNLQIYKIYSTITVLVIPAHPPKGKYFQKVGLDQAVRKTLLGETLVTVRNKHLQRGAIWAIRRATVTLHLLRPAHPPKVK